MKQRRNIFKKLEETVPKELLPMVVLLFEEMKEFFYNLALYHQNEKYTRLFQMLYESKKTYTNLEKAYCLYNDIKVVQRFINDLERFVPEFIKTHRKYFELKRFIQQ